MKTNSCFYLVGATVALLAYSPYGATNPKMSLTEALADLDSRSIETVQHHAEQGDASARYYLGRLAETGERGTAIDPVAAARWFRQAGSSGLLEAQIRMGVRYERGLGTLRDDSEAIAWFQQSTNSGTPVALLRYGLAHVFPLAGATNNSGIAARFVDEALLAGYPFAASVVSHAGSKAFHVFPDEQRRSVIEQALKQLFFARDHTNRFRLALHAAKIGGIESRALDRHAGRLDENTRRRIEAEEADWKPVSVEPAVMSRELQRANWELLVPGIGRSAFSTNAFNDLLGQAEAGDSLAQYQAGICFLSCPVARAPVMHMASNTVVEARFALREIDQARDWMKRAAQAGHEPARLQLGWMILNGIAERSEMGQAIQYATAPAKKGDRRFQHLLGAIRLLDPSGQNLDQTEALKWLRTAAENGCTDAAALLGRELFSGRRLSRDNVEGLKWLRVAAKAGHLSARGLILREYGEATLAAEPVDKAPETKTATPVPNKDVGIAIVGVSSDVPNEAIDLLTVAASGLDGVAVLERSELQRILSEQELNLHSSTDQLRFGKLLGADGMLLLDIDSVESRSFLSQRLVAVGPGVVVGRRTDSLQITDLSGWSRIAAEELKSLIPKLAVERNEAVPVSLVKVTSPLDSQAAREVARAVNLLLAERLTAEPSLFVLERDHLGAAAGEKSVAADGVAEFWNGAYVISGEINKLGGDLDNPTIELRLVGPDGGSVGTISESGHSQALPELIDRLCRELAVKIGARQNVPSWSPLTEALRYVDDGEWSLKWKHHDRALAAAETAWIFGLRNIRVGTLKIAAITAALGIPEKPASYRWEGKKLREVKWMEQGEIGRCSMGLRFFVDATRKLELESESIWMQAGFRLLVESGRLLRLFYHHRELLVGHEDSLARLRTDCCAAADVLKNATGMLGTFSVVDHKSSGNNAHLWVRNWKDLTYGPARYWQVSPEAARDHFTKLVEGKGFDRTELWDAVQETPLLPNWQNEETATVREQLCSIWSGSTNGLLKVESLLLQMEPFVAGDEHLKGLFQQLASTVTANADVLFALPDYNGFQSFANHLKAVLTPKFTDSKKKKDPAVMKFLSELPSRRLRWQAERTAGGQVRTTSAAATRSGVPQYNPGGVGRVVGSRVRPGLQSQKPGNPTPLVSAKFVQVFAPEWMKLREHEFDAKPGFSVVIGEDYWLGVQVSFYQAIKNTFGMSKSAGESFQLYRRSLKSGASRVFPVDSKFYGRDGDNPRFDWSSMAMIEGRIYLSVDGTLIRSSLNTESGAWELLAENLPKRSRLWACGDRLVVTSAELIEVFDTIQGGRHLLASTKRNPSLTPLDRLQNIDSVAAIDSDAGLIFGVTGAGVFRVDAELKQWREHRDPGDYGAKWSYSNRLLRWSNRRLDAWLPDVGRLDSLILGGNGQSSSRFRPFGRGRPDSWQLPDELWLGASPVFQPDGEGAFVFTGQSPIDPTRGAPAVVRKSAAMDHEVFYFRSGSPHPKRFRINFTLPETGVYVARHYPVMQDTVRMYWTRQGLVIAVGNISGYWLVANEDLTPILGNQSGGIGN